MMLSFDPKLKSYVTHPYIFWDGWFSEEELQTIENVCINSGTERAKVINENGIAYESSIRPCNTKFHMINDNNAWFIHKMAALLEHVNNKYYQYDVWGFEGFQYTEYTSEKNDRYGYHMDMITGDNIPEYLRMPRKLSLSLILSNPTEYDNGEFEFKVSEENLFQPEQKRGRAIIFPSYILHKINPVTRGVRRSIVTWVVGPKFR